MHTRDSAPEARPRTPEESRPEESARTSRGPSLAHWVTAIAFLVLLQAILSRPHNETLAHSEFKTLLAARMVSDVVVDQPKSGGSPHPFVANRVDDPALVAASVVTGHDECEQTLNQLLAEMDGFDASKGVMILAAITRPEMLDPALLRPGRFDPEVVIDQPEVRGRESRLTEVAATNGLGIAGRAAVTPVADAALPAPVEPVS